MRSRLARPADAALARARRRGGPLHGVPFTIKDSLDTAGVVTTAGTVGLARPRPGASTRPSWRACARRRRDPAGQDEHARVHLGERDRQRRLRPDLEPLRPRPDARRQQRRVGGDRRGRRLAVRHRQRQRQQHPPARAPVRRRGDQADERPRAADRATGRASRACSSRSRSSARSPAGSRTSRSSCRSSPARTGRIRTSCRRRSAIRRPSTSRGSRVAWFGDNGDPDADARDDRRGPGRRRCDRRDRGAPSRSRCRPTSPPRGRPGRP